mmetsp:Transcript_30503/g.90504  ORF Transcript_30503/g.90504 Transcript_30503/m.90504 type:complete len:308 (-) Transcript_30503:299-1222(-)
MRHRRLREVHRPAGGVAGCGAGVRAAAEGSGRRGRALRLCRQRQLPSREGPPQHGVPPDDCSPEASVEHDRRRGPRARCPGAGDARVLPVPRLPVRAHPAHHLCGLRGRRRDVPGDHHDGRDRKDQEDRLRAGLLRQARLPHGQRPAGSGELLLRHVQRLHLWPDLPRGELAHLQAPGRVLDDRAGARLRGRPRRHGLRRGLPQVLRQVRDDPQPRGPAVLRRSRREGPAQPPGEPAEGAVRAGVLHRGHRDPAQGVAQGQLQGARRVGHGHGLGAREVSGREGQEEAHHRVQLPEGYQGLLHEAQR